jgi:phage terminase large subunit GpA-like protein
MNGAEFAITSLLDAHFRVASMTPVEWCETVRRMKGGMRFSFDYAPYQREIFESFYDRSIALVALAIFSRGGKTELCSNFIGESIQNRPKEIIFARPQQNSVELYSKNEFQGKLINPTPELAAILPDGAGRRLGNNTIRSKYYPGGFVNFIGMNSGTDVRTVTGQAVIVDEADSVKSEEGDEGDKIKNVLGRADEFGENTQIITSYPLYKGDSAIWRYLSASDWRQWFVVHKSCGHEYVMHRSQIKRPPGQPSRAVLLCPKCEVDIPPEEWRAMWSCGEWRATRNPDSNTRGYQMNGMSWPHPVNSAFKNFFHWMAHRMEEITNDPNPEKAKMVLVNRFDAEPYQPESIAKAEPDELVRRREEYQIEGEIPEEVISITFGADVQADRIEAEIVGHGLEDRTWGLGFHVISGRPERSTTWDKLTKLIETKWAHPKLGEIGIDGGCIDSKFRPDNVRAWTAKHRTKHIYAIIGSVNLGKPIITKPSLDVVTVGSRRMQVQIYEIGTHEAKDRIYQRLLLDKPDAGEYPHGFMHYPVADCYDSAYFEGLTVEVPAMKRGSDGEWYRHFSCKNGQRNEPLDCRVYAMAAQLICRPPMATRAAKIGLKTISKPDNEGAKGKESAKTRRNGAFRVPRLGRVNPF